ncbi:esterase-like activity of phytase family protein [Massilia sp. B-10]|nr:esterase-like activity of phytase family protein [Massilia sp. B-10]
MRVSNDGQHVYITDEYGPLVYEFHRQTGKRMRVFTLPPEFAVSRVSPEGADEIAHNLSGRVANKGMEGLAISPDGKKLIGMMQSPLAQDGGVDGRFTRIVVIDIETGSVTQHAYPLTNIGTAAKPKYPTVSEIVAINDHEFLVDERDGKGFGDDSKAVYKKIFRIDLAERCRRQWRERRCRSGPVRSEQDAVYRCGAVTERARLCSQGYSGQTGRHGLRQRRRHRRRGEAYFVCVKR